MWAAIGALLGAPPTVSAQAIDAQALRQEIEALRTEFEALRLQYDNRLRALEARLPALDAPAPTPPGEPPSQTAQVPAGVDGAGGPSGTLPLYGAASTASKIFNPDIAVIGDVLGAAGRNRVDPGPALSFHEAEVSLQSIVDPYARADFFLSFGEEGVELEEGFLTFPAVPGGLLVRVGKLRSAFGTVNTLHTHALTWTDRPLVVTNLLGGEDGLTDTGISVARLIPNPWLFLEATGQLFRGDASDVFRSSQRGDVSVVGHLRGYQDLTESTNIGLGVSFARGHNASGVFEDVDLGRFTTRVVGVDATVRWRPLRRSIYRSFLGRSEIVWSRREQPGPEQRAFGYYVSGDYQMARRWSAGVRFDRSDRADEDALRDVGPSALLTYKPSEISQIRGQYRRIGYAVGDTAHEFLFQFQFSIGAHGAHPF
jgi:hypothetical protein